MEKENPQRTEGIILKVIDFRDYDQIMTVFTPDRGIIKLLMKKKKLDSNSSVKLSPLTRAEFVFTPNQGEIWKCKETAILNYYLKLREQYAWLETSGRFIKSIFLTQIEHKPAPLIYKLLLVYLEKIPHMPNMESLEISFMLKILKHEGFINTDLHCSTCRIPLTKLSITRGDHYCSIHAPKGSIPFNEEETLSFMQLAACQTFSELKAIPISEHLNSKTQHLFHERF